jgi:Chaperone of endosialidase
VLSSARFKEAIKPMDKASEAVLSLKPVTFRYKHELDPDGTPQFGLVAEQVEKVNPDLVVRDADGKVNTVRYEAVNAMLLNEFVGAQRRKNGRPFVHCPEGKRTVSPNRIQKCRA